MQKTKVSSYLIFFALIALFQIGCSQRSFITTGQKILRIYMKTDVVIYQHKDFRPQSPDVITVLPVVDGRLIVKQGDDFEKETRGLQELIAATLKKKRYDCEVSDNANAMGGIHPSQIPFLDASHISEIGPGDSGWILVPVVNDFFRIYGAPMGAAMLVKYTALPTHPDITCYLFEKRSGKLMWEGNATYLELKTAAQDLMHSFPAKE